MSEKRAQYIITDAPFRGAQISQCERYRFRLWRRWGRGRLCVWLMLNPSTADATEDDATIRRCIGFARRWGYPGIEVVNLFPLRETDAKVAMRNPDRFGPGTANHHAVRSAVRINGNVTCAWGAHAPQGPGLDFQVDELEKLVGWQQVFCLGVTKSGQPRHPVRLPYAVERVPLAVAQGRRPAALEAAP